MKGKLLIATPELLTDNIFSKTVIIIADEHESGKVGFIINKPLPVTVKDISGINLPFQVYEGGPVSGDRLYFIHKVPDLIPGGLHIRKDLYWGGNILNPGQIARQSDFLADKIKFFVGYSGWGLHQLENEISDGAWLVNDKYLDVININPKNIWKELLVETKPELVLWKDAPNNPSMN
jgi:putative transcriptional regulator